MRTEPARGAVRERPTLVLACPAGLTLSAADEASPARVEGGRQLSHTRKAHHAPARDSRALYAVSLFGQTTPVEQGRAAIGRGDSDAAIEILEKAVAQSPKSADAHYYLGSAYGSKVQASGMLAGARYASRITEEFEKAVALDPRYVEAHFGLVQVYANAPGIMGRPDDKAFDHAKAIKAIDPIVGHRAYASIYAAEEARSGGEGVPRRHP